MLKEESPGTFSQHPTVSQHWDSGVLQQQVMQQASPATAYKAVGAFYRSTFSLFPLLPSADATVNTFTEDS